MTGRTIRLISLCATFWIARSLRHIRRRTSVAESIGFLPRSDSLHQGIDLFVSEHSPCTLRERGHCSSAHTVGNDAANCGVVRNCEKNGIRQSDGCPALAVRTVASCAVLSVDKIEVRNFVWRITSDSLPGRPGELLQPVEAKKATMAAPTRMGWSFIDAAHPRCCFRPLLLAPQPQRGRGRGDTAKCVRALAWTLLCRRRPRIRSAI